MKPRVIFHLHWVVVLVAAIGGPAIGGPVQSVAVPAAELFATKTDDGVLLHGLHYRPPEGPPERPQDPRQGESKTVVIHVPGGPGAFYSAQDMAPLAGALNRAAIHFLSVNLRTAGTNGMLYARFEDYRLDIAAVLRYAQDQGLTNIVLLGHSLSSARVFYYYAKTRDPAVKAIIVSAGITSPYLESQLRWSEPERARFDEFLAERRDDVKAGRSRALSSFLWGPNRNFEFSAATWVNMFGNPEDSNASTLKFARDITVPVLIVHGTKDGTALPENANQIFSSLNSNPRRELVWIDGGDHLFVGTADRYAEVVASWVIKTLGGAPKLP